MGLIAMVVGGQVASCDSGQQRRARRTAIVHRRPSEREKWRYRLVRRFAEEHIFGVHGNRCAPFQPRFDVLVSKNGEVVWRRLHDLVFTLPLAYITLGAGEAITRVVEWDMHSNEGVLVPPGEYKVYGETDVVLENSVNLVTEPHPLQITG
ncbi:MAG TPA: BsuPI-related putative proteinase inhibitor [Gemmatimonadota bacterium]|nr:BsuPI-related putative proteinase inhibitor [Gemmatimonadota bacterium]